MTNFTRFWVEIRLKTGATIYGRKWPTKPPADEEIKTLVEKARADGRPISSYGVMQDGDEA